MTIQAVNHVEQIALSASHAAWVGAAASTFASVVALAVAVWGARREEGRRRRLAKDQETAFSFGMVGAFEMIKPIIIEMQTNPQGETARRKFLGMADHANTIVEAAVAIQVFDMQMLRDAYSFRGVLNALRSLPEDRPGEAVSNMAVRDIIEPVLSDMLEADDRFFARLPAIAEIKGIGGRTQVDRPA